MALTTGSHLARSQFYGSFGGHCDTGGSPLTPWSLVLVVLDPCWRTAPSSQHKLVIERQQFTARRSFKCVCVWHRPPAIKVLLRDQYLGGGRVGGADLTATTSAVGGRWLRRAVYHWPTCCTTVNCDTRRWRWRRNPLRHDHAGTPRRWVVSLTTLDIFYESMWLNLVIFLLALRKPWWFIDFRSKSDFSVKRIFKKRKIGKSTDFSNSSARH